MSRAVRLPDRLTNEIGPDYDQVMKHARTRRKRESRYLPLPWQIDATGQRLSRAQNGPRPCDLFHRAGIDAEQAVDRTCADQTGQQRDDPDLTPRCRRPDKDHRDQHQPEHNAQGAINRSFVACHLESPFARCTQSIAALAGRNGDSVTDRARSPVSDRPV